MRIFKALTIGVVGMVCWLAGNPAAWAQTGMNPEVVYLTDLKPVAVNREVPGKEWMEGNWKIGPCQLRGREFKRSISWEHRHSEGVATFLANRRFDYFEAYVGFNDTYPNEGDRVIFSVVGDNRELAKSDELRVGDEPFHFRVPITDVARLELRVNDHLRVGNVWWGDARLIKGQALPSVRIDSWKPGIGEPLLPPESAVTGTKILRLDPERLKDLATDLKESVAGDPDLAQEKPTLAIAGFKLIPATVLDPSNADNVREDLTTALIKSKAFNVVERGQLEQVLREQKIGLKDIFDSATLQKIGRLVQARTVLIGSISDRGTYAVVNVRLIDTQTGRAGIAASMELRQ